MYKNQKIQVLRGIAIIAVILIHTCPKGLPQVYIRPFINFGVGMFLFLSGYLTKAQNENWLSFYKKRIGKVAFPYIIWTVIYTLLLQHPDRIIFNLLTARTAATFYYIPVYIQFVLLTPLLSNLIRSTRRWIGWLIAPLSVIIFLYVPLFSGVELPDKVSIIWNISCLGWFSFYFLGFAIGNHRVRINSSLKFLITFYVVAIVLQILEGRYWLSIGSWDPATQLKLTALLTSSAAAILGYRYIVSEKFSVRPRFLAKIGDHAFGIYLTHLLFQSLLWKIPVYQQLPFIVNSFIILAISFSFVHFCSLVFGEQMKRILGLQ